MTANSPFLKPNDPRLQQKSHRVTPDQLDSPVFKYDLEQLLYIAHGEQAHSEKPVLVGLAAPQVGILRRIILVDLRAEGHGTTGDLRIYLNPVITWSSQEEAEWYEGCFSTGRVCGIVSRPQHITVEASTPEGHRITEHHSGYTARIFQHEIDHLNGIEFITHITNDNDLHWVEKIEFPMYRNNEGWRNWPHKCPRERWHQMKGLNTN